MKGHVAATLALGGALFLAGCGSGGGGPATSPFDPFGSEPSGASGEPSGPSSEGPASSDTIANLCATDCSRIMSACPSAAGSNCVGSCEASFLEYPACTSQAQAYLECIANITIVCSGGTSIDVSGCAQSVQALESCINPGSTVMGTPTY